MLREIGQNLKENYEKVKAELKGEARSQVRMIKAAKDIPDLHDKLNHQGGPQPAEGIQGAFVRMKDGDPMQFYTDGSLRHAAGYKPGKAARKARKKMRRANAHQL